MNKEPASDYPTHSIVDKIRQSPPIDVDRPYKAEWVKGKTILITGGASGFGAGFAKTWATNGANVIIGDINKEGGEKLAQEIRDESGQDNCHFVYCNVCDWLSQVSFFKEAVKLSSHGGIDVVVANAGIAGVDNFELPQGLDADAPPKPNLKTIDVNLIGVLYTVHLALFWLPRNPGSKVSSPNNSPLDTPRDRHLLLIGSMASLCPIPAQVLYAASKHAVLGVFRTLRATSWIHGVRVNLVCPYFIDTPIMPASARVMLAGGGTGKPEDVVDAGTRFVADTRIVGRSLYIGPKLTVVQDDNGDVQIATKPSKDSQQRAVWEAYAHDYDDSELFARNLIRLLNRITTVRGWTGWFQDMWKAVIYGVRTGKANNNLGR